MILFLFSIFNMKTLFSIVSPPTFHLAPRSLLLGQHVGHVDFLKVLRLSFPVPVVPLAFAAEKNKKTNRSRFALVKF